MMKLLLGTSLSGAIRIRRLVIVAAVPVVVATPTWANGGSNLASLAVGKAQVYTFSVPFTDTGSQAYPTTATLGADRDLTSVDHVARYRVPAYRHGFDVGSRAYLEPQ